MERGIQYLEKSDYDKARVEFRNAARINPTSAEVYYYFGVLDEAKGQIRNAVGNYLHAEMQDPSYVPARLKIAQFALASGAYDEAQTRLTAVLDLDPNNVEAHAVQGALNLRREDYAGAEREARFALEKEPGNMIAISVLTGLYMAKKEPERANQVVDEGLKSSPDNEGLLLLKASVAERQDNIERFEEAYRQIFQKDPANVARRSEMAQKYLQLGRVDDAERTLREGIKADPSSVALHQALVYFLAETRGLDAAEAEVKLAKTQIKSEARGANPDFWLADIFLRRGEADRAESLLREMSSSGDEDTRLGARTVLAQIAYERGKTAEADQMVRDILKDKPDYTAALLLRARLAFDKGLFQEVVSDARTILRDQPDSVDAMRLLAEALFAQGRVDLAIEEQNALVTAAPEDVAAKVRLAQFYDMHQDATRALDILQQVTENTPDYPVGWESMARIGIAQEKYDLVNKAIGELRRLDGQALLADYLQGVLDLRQGKPDVAVPLLRKVASSDPTSPLGDRALNTLVQTWSGSGQYDQALEFLRSLKSEDIGIRLLTGEVLIAQGKLDEARTLYEDIAREAPNTGAAYLALASIRAQEGDVEAAKGILNEGIKSDPQDLRIPMMLASILTSEKNYTEAIKIYDGILKVNPEYDLAANNLAALISDFQYTDPQALERARRLAERFQSSENPIALDTLGWVYYRQGELDRAITYLKRVVAAMPGEPQLHYHYGAALYKKGMKDQAREELEAAVVEGAEYPGIEDARKMLNEL